MLALILGQFNIVDSLYLPGGYINGVAWDGSTVWITNNDSDPGTKLHQVDPDSMTVLLTYNYTYAGGGFDGLTYAEGFLYPTYYPDYSIWKIDPADGSHDATYSAPTSDYVYGMAFDGQHIWFTDKDLQELWELDPADMSPVRGPISLSFTPKDAGWLNGHLYIMGDDDVLRLVDTTDGSVIWQARFPRTYCAGLAFGGGYMWVGTNNATGKLYKVAFQEPLLTREDGRRPDVKLVGEVLVLPEGTWSLRAYSADGRLVWRRDGASGRVRLPKLGFFILEVKGGGYRQVLKGIIAE